MITAGFALALAKSGLKLLSAGAKAADHDNIARALEVIGASTELADTVRDRPREVVQESLARLQKQIEQEYRPWLDAEFGADWAGGQQLPQRHRLKAALGLPHHRRHCVDCLFPSRPREGALGRTSADAEQ